MPLRGFGIPVTLSAEGAPCSSGRSMPSEKAKENKALVATCAACQKAVSTEMMVALTGNENGKR